MELRVLQYFLDVTCEQNILKASKSLHLFTKAAEKFLSKLK